MLVNLFYKESKYEKKKKKFTGGGGGGELKQVNFFFTKNPNLKIIF